MKAYKGFNKDLQCTPGGKVFQYEVGGEYSEDKAEVCKTGFHACANPLEVLSYYPPADSRYCEVELDGVAGEKSGGTKLCATSIKVTAEIGLPGLIKAGVAYIKAQVNWEGASATNTGYQSAATVGSGGSVAVATGYEGRAAASPGSAICLAERGSNGELLRIKAAIIDGENLKPDTYYTLKNGEFVEVCK